MGIIEDRVKVLSFGIYKVVMIWLMELLGLCDFVCGVEWLLVVEYKCVFMEF